MVTQNAVKSEGWRRKKTCKNSSRTDWVGQGSNISERWHNLCQDWMSRLRHGVLRILAELGWIMNTGTFLQKIQESGKITVLYFAWVSHRVAMSVCPSICLSICLFQGLSSANTGHIITSQAFHCITPPHMILVAEELWRTPHSFCTHETWTLMLNTLNSLPHLLWSLLMKNFEELLTHFLPMKHEHWCWSLSTYCPTSCAPCCWRTLKNSSFMVYTCNMNLDTEQSPSAPLVLIFRSSSAPLLLSFHNSHPTNK